MGFRIWCLWVPDSFGNGDLVKDLRKTLLVGSTDQSLESRRTGMIDISDSHSGSWKGEVWYLFKPVLRWDYADLGLKIGDISYDDDALIVSIHGYMDRSFDRYGIRTLSTLASLVVYCDTGSIILVRKLGVSYLCLGLKVVDEVVVFKLVLEYMNTYSWSSWVGLLTKLEGNLGSRLYYILTCFDLNKYISLSRNSYLKWFDLVIWCRQGSFLWFIYMLMVQWMWVCIVSLEDRDTYVLVWFCLDSWIVRRFRVELLGIMVLVCFDIGFVSQVRDVSLDYRFLALVDNGFVFLDVWICYLCHPYQNFGCVWNEHVEYLLLYKCQHEIYFFVGSVISLIVLEFTLSGLVSGFHKIVCSHYFYRVTVVLKEIRNVIAHISMFMDVAGSFYGQCDLIFELFFCWSWYHSLHLRIESYSCWLMFLQIEFLVSWFIIIVRVVGAVKVLYFCIFWYGLCLFFRRFSGRLKQYLYFTESVFVITDLQLCFGLGQFCLCGLGYGLCLLVWWLLGRFNHTLCFTQLFLLITDIHLGFDLGKFCFFAFRYLWVMIWRTEWVMFCPHKSRRRQGSRKTVVLFHWFNLVLKVLLIIMMCQADIILLLVQHPCSYMVVWDFIYGFLIFIGWWYWCLLVDGLEFCDLNQWYHKMYHGLQAQTGTKIKMQGKVALPKPPFRK